MKQDPIKYDKLNLFKLDELRGEVGRRLNQMKNKKNDTR